jgi:hypothetical protein
MTTGGYIDDDGWLWVYSHEEAMVAACEMVERAAQQLKPPAHAKLVRH